MATNDSLIPGDGKAAVKDLLQGEPTPYEVLGLGRRASNADVQAAFALGIANRGNVQKLTSAKKVLQNPADRALVDLLHYLPEWAGELEPNLWSQSSALDQAHRADTARAWEGRLKAGFPDIGAAHSLAVLWYWWTVWTDQQPAATPAAHHPGLTSDQMWQKAIACWAMLLSSEEFWKGSGVPQEIAANVASGIIDRLNGDLRAAGQKHRQTGSAVTVARYQALELALTTERRTAKLMAGAGIRTGRGKLTAGILMLEHVGLLDDVRQQVGERARRSPTNELFRELQDALSAYASIAALIDVNKPQLALEAIDALPAEKRTSTEVGTLRARALHGIAKQRADLNNFDEALDNWKAALDCTPPAELRAEIVAAAVSSCHARAASIQQRQADAAIALLERAVTIFDDLTLKLILADLLTNRAIETINASEGSDRVTVLEMCLLDLERASGLGSKRATEQVATVRSMLEQLSADADLSDVQTGIAARLGKNPSLADLTAEIEKLEARTIKGTAAKSILAQLFNARAVAGLNGLSEAVEGAKAAAARQIRALFRWGWLPRIPFYLLLPIVLYFAYRTRQLEATAIKAGLVWGGLFSIWCVARAFLQSLKFDRLAAPGMNALLFCKVCARMTSNSFSLPGYGDACLCSTHEQEVNSIVHDSVQNAVHFTAWSAAQDVHRALELWPDFKEAKETLASIEQVDPTAVTKHGMSPQADKVINALDDFMAARPEDTDRWEAVECPRCHGRGDCDLCLGKRVVSAYRHELRMLDKPDIPVLCPSCNGTRSVSGLPCHRCRGTGMQQVPRKEFRRILRRPYARPFSKYHGVREWQHGILVGLLFGPLCFRHIKRLAFEREKVMISMLRGDQDFQGIRFGAMTWCVILGLCVVNYFLRSMETTVTTITLIVTVLWAWLFWTTRKTFKKY